MARAGEILPSPGFFIFTATGITGRDLTYIPASKWSGRLYIRSVRNRGIITYVLRESFHSEGFFKHRDLLNLGGSPEDFIEYPGGNGFYFSQELEDALDEKGVEYSSEDLEEAFYPFIASHIREVIEKFRARGSQRRAERQYSDIEMIRTIRSQSRLHTFDRRRMHYLRFGRLQMGEIDGRTWKFLEVLADKSRDEIEHIIEQMERKLRPHEIRPYLYTSLRIREIFSDITSWLSTLKRWMPSFSMKSVVSIQTQSLSIEEKIGTMGFCIPIS